MADEHELLSEELVHRQVDPLASSRDEEVGRFHLPEGAIQALASSDLHCSLDDLIASRPELVSHENSVFEVGHVLVEERIEPIARSLSVVQKPVCRIRRQPGGEEGVTFL